MGMSTDINIGLDLCSCRIIPIAPFQHTHPVSALTDIKNAVA